MDRLIGNIWDIIVEILPLSEKDTKNHYFYWMEALIEWLEAHQMPCYYKKFLGIECLGCGMQTALILLLKGEFWESIKTFPALLPIMFIGVFLILHLIFKFRKGAFILKISFIFTVTIQVLSYIYKIIYH